MRRTSRTLGAVLAALLIAAPAAAATQDLRSPDARYAAAINTRDLRSPDARDAGDRAQGSTSSPAPTTSREHNPGRTDGSARPAPNHGNAAVDRTPIAFALVGGLLAIAAAAGISSRRCARAAT